MELLLLFGAIFAIARAGSDDDASAHHDSSHLVGIIFCIVAGAMAVACAISLCYWCSMRDDETSDGIGAGAVTGDATAIDIEALRAQQADEMLVPCLRAYGAIQDVE